MFKPSKIVINYNAQIFATADLFRITLPRRNSTLLQALSSQTPKTLKQVLSKLRLSLLAKNQLFNLVIHILALADCHEASKIKLTRGAFNRPQRLTSEAVSFLSSHKFSKSISPRRHRKLSPFCLLINFLSFWHRGDIVKSSEADHFLSSCKFSKSFYPSSVEGIEVFSSEYQIHRILSRGEPPHNRTRTHHG